MYHHLYHWPDIGVTAEVSLFHPETATPVAAGDDDALCHGVGELHAMLHVTPCGDLFVKQLERLVLAEARLYQMHEFQGAQSVLKRYFVSDAANQISLIEQCLSESRSQLPAQAAASVSVIQQPPLDGSKVALWIYMQQGTQVEQTGSLTQVAHNGYRHLYQSGMVSPEGNSYQQTQSLLSDYAQTLGACRATLEGNCIRTWFFVRDVDTQYEGLVRARREFFAAEGLTEKSHYVASTGIGGLPADTHAIVQLGAYALVGFEPEQRRQLYASSHLNPTYEYGVTFERGTVVEYGDRAEIFISGTASINNKGEVVHVGDIVGQTERMCENVEQLLAEGDATFDDVVQIIVYLRDMADYPVVAELMKRRFAHIPRVITLAPVCRPAWLIEMECMAIVPRENPQYRNF